MNPVETTKPPAPVVVSAAGLEYSAGRRKILNGVSFEVRRGESYLVLAANGAGKTTLLKVLTGMISPDQGRVTIEGEDIHTIPRELLQNLRTRVRLIFDDGVLLSNMSLQDNIGLPLTYHTHLDAGTIRERVHEEMARLRILEYAAEFPPAVDRSVRRRAHIAAVLMLPPDILFFDSPLAGFDAVTANLVQTRIARMREERTVTLIMTSHTLETLSAVTDHLGILEGGRMTHSGTLGKIVDMLKLLEDSRLGTIE